MHLAANGAKPAIIFEGEPGDSHTLTYRQLTAEVCRFANALKAQGIQPGDRIVIYMPMVPEAVIAMQACARIGATHSVVFGGFSANSLRDRITNGEKYLGGTSATENTVTAWKLNAPGNIGMTEIQSALNRF